MGRWPFLLSVQQTGDGWKGWAEKGPYDAIHVGAAAETIPEDLVSQLKVGGRMVVPVGPQSSSQMLVQVCASFAVRIFLGGGEGRGEL